ncbi:MAG: tryptophan--tRNA ligase [Dokdonella sp.]
MTHIRVLTGITTTGTPHLGNYVGAIRPAIAASESDGVESFFFLADYHALVKCDDPARVRQSTLEIAASWLACGLDPERVFFYRQSDIPEIPELTWLLTCVTAKGLLNRAHAYKAAVDQNSANGEDPDAGINAGLYLYPVLMAADILAFNAHRVPVGRDQVQHIEMARDIAQRFNHLYHGGFFVQPEAQIDDNVATLPGLDGRKMSKSYNNVIPLWLDGEALRKAILGIVTDSRAPGEMKDADSSDVFAIYRAFANAEEAATMRQAFADGIAWGDAKQKLFERIDAELAAPRAHYRTLIEQPDRIEDLLQAGAERARARARPLLASLRDAVGIGSLRNRVLEMSATAIIGATATVTLAHWKNYREADGKFYFKLVAPDGATLLQSRGFESPKDSGRRLAELSDASAISATDADGEGRTPLRDSTGEIDAWSHVDIEMVKSAIAAMNAAKAAKAAKGGQS